MNLSEMPTANLPSEAAVVNVGLPLFGDTLRAQGIPVVDVDWRIPAGGDEQLIAGLTWLHGARSASIEAANTEVIRRLDEATPALHRVRRAADVVPGMGDGTVLHPGPPLEFERFCDPLRRSLYATVVSAGWAEDSDAARRLIEAGEVDLQPANHHATALPMASTVGPDNPVFEVHDAVGGNVGFSAINQGPGRRAWMGMDSHEAVAHLCWLREVAAPLLDQVLRENEPIDVFSIAAQAVQMGDDVHMRLQAATSLLIRQLAPRIAGLDDPRRVELATYLSENYLFFLNLVIAASKTTVDWAAEVEGSTIVTCMSRNGTTFGVRIAGCDQWAISDAPEVGAALYRSDFGADDAAPDIGDSAIVELVGLGGAAAAGSPAVAGFVGGRMEDAIARTREFGQICRARSSRFKLPTLDFEGTPLGIDLRIVVDLEISPSITTGILDRSEGRGQVGAGLATAPLEVFQRALLDLVASQRAQDANPGAAEGPS
jgi:hypothetical protein